MMETQLMFDITLSLEFNVVKVRRQTDCKHYN